mgnify:CR=1 FL=1
MIMKRLIAFLLLLTLSFSTLCSCSALTDLFGDKNNSKEQGGNGANSGTQGDNIGNTDEDKGNNSGGSSNDFNDKNDVDHSFDPVCPEYDLDAELAKVNVPERFKVAYTIEREKLENAAAAATAKLKSFAEKNGTGFIGTHSVDYKYTSSENRNWICGMYTGSYLMAYQLTGDKKYARRLYEEMKNVSS